MPTTPRHRIFGGILIPNATVFTSSLCVLVVELVAGRLISRYLGQSLYTWTTIIGVILGGITIGNYLGGRLADRSYSRRTIGSIFFLSALSCLLVLGLNALVGRWTFLWGLPWPARIICHISLVFLLPSAVLGMVSPVVTRRALALGLATGRTMGNIYACGAAGAIVGSFLTGLYLQTVLGAQAIVGLSAAGLAITGALYMAGSFLEERRTAEQHAEKADSRPWSFREALFPASTVFLVNVGIMAIQLAAGRIMSLSYGQSLYTWTSVIGIIIAGISLGNYIGGILADRYRARPAIALLLVLSSLCCVYMPWLNNWMKDWIPLLFIPYAAQVAIHVGIIFLLPSTLLGAVNPLAAKMALEQGHAAGRTVGTVYASGSLGSIVGTFLTGFYLIAAWGRIGVIVGAAALLAAMALLYAPKRSYVYIWAAVCGIIVFLAIAPWPAAAKAGAALALREPQTPGVLLNLESQYSYIRVSADPKNPDKREMVLDKLVHSQVNIKTPQVLGYEYEWVYAQIINQYHKPIDSPINALIVGGGGYTFPHYLEIMRPGSKVVVAEIDPEVTEAAFKAFGLPRDTSIDIYNMDARNLVDDFLRKKEAGEDVPQFDFILGDAVNDYSVPYHITTREYLQSIDKLLAPDGIYMLNMIDSPLFARFLGAAINTCRSVFPNVYVFNTFPDRVRDTFILVCAKRPLDLEQIPNNISMHHKYNGGKLSASKVDMLARKAGGVILTDDFAPVDNMLADVVSTSARVNAAETQVRRIESLLAQKQYDTAVSKARDLAKRFPNWPLVQAAFGSALLESGAYEEAIGAFKMAIQADPASFVSYEALGNTYKQLGRFNEAMEAWNKAIQLAPKYPNSYVNLAACQAEMGELDAAIQTLNTCVAMAPNTANAHNNLGAYLFEKSDFDGARAHLEHAAALAPADGEIAGHLAPVYWKLKDFERAWQQVKKARSLGFEPSPEFIKELQRDSGRNE